MARKIIWAKIAQNERKKIFEFWNDRNKSKEYSKKLQNLFKESLKIVSKNPLIGKKTDIDGVRIKIIRDYQLFYQHTNKQIFVLMLWDSRQNPDKLTNKKTSR